MAARQMPLEYLMTAKIDEKGRIAVPKQFRENLGLGTGAPIAVLRLGDGLILLPEQRHFNLFCKRIDSALTSAGVTQKALLATLPETRQRIFERRYSDSHFRKHQ
jgi:AbrB family looped-hinge helix DNA binding protein